MFYASQKSCKVCGKPFFNIRLNNRGWKIGSKYTNAKWQKAKYCSRKCYYADFPNRINNREGTGLKKECIICGKIFKKGGRTINQWQKAKYCSIQCLAKSKVGIKRPDMIAILAKNRLKHRGKKHWNWNGGKIVNSQGYILIYSPIHPYADKRGYVREHRLVMEKKIGRYLNPKEVVHHVNGIKDNNGEENLMLFENDLEHRKFEKLAC